jgi:hypothetical protein
MMKKLMQTLWVWLTYLLRERCGSSCKALWSLLWIRYLAKISTQGFNTRLGTIDYNKEFIVAFRKQCKNVKLRNIHFRYVPKDFFTMEKMFKYKMVNSDKCSRCGDVESYRHLLWDCLETKRVWQAFNA